MNLNLAAPISALFQKTPPADEFLLARSPGFA